MEAHDFRSDCPINYALEFLGDKWSLLIIRDFVFEGKRYYKDLLNAKEGIATNVLSERLKRLEGLGIVRSEVSAENRRMKQYTLTDKGKDLIPMLLEIIEWSAKHQDGLNVHPAFLAKLKANKGKVAEAVRAAVGTTAFSAHQ